MDDVDVPILNNVRISHLLWADDLVLLDLNAESLQKTIDQLFAFGLEWGLSVNIKKTAVLVFNKSGRLKKMIDFKRLKKNILFKLFGKLIQPVVSYGCQEWLPETWYVKYTTGQTRPNYLQNIAKDPLEVLHLT